MRKFISSVVVVLLLVGPAAMSQSTFGEIDSGLFVIAIDGQEALYENLGLYQLPDGSYELNSTILLSFGESQVTRLQRLRYDESFLPVEYFRQNLTADGDEAIRVSLSGDVATMTIESSEDPLEETFTTEREFSLLDRNAGSHWYGLHLRRQFLGVDLHTSDTINPTNRNSYESRLFSVGEVQLFSGIEVVHAEELRYESGVPDNSDEEEFLRLFVADGKLVAIIEPSEGDEVILGYRKDLYPDGLEIPGL